MEDLCDHVRWMYKLELPVDVLKLARCLKIDVYSRSWAELPHAISLVDVRIVVLNATRSENSRRFDLAHELAHFILAGSELYHTNRENRFAAALLMPKREFQLEVLIARGEAPRVARIFGVSIEAVRLRNVQLRR